MNFIPCRMPSWLATALLPLFTFLFAGGAVAAPGFAHNFGGQLGLTVVVNATAVDASGNEYLAGYFDGPTLVLDGTVLSRIGNIDAFVAKLDVNRNVIWARNFGGINTDTIIQALAVDATGNAYLGGSFRFGNLTTPALTRLGDGDAFALRIDSSTGAIAWAKNFGGLNAYTLGQAVAVDNAGGVYLSGTFSNADLTVPALTRIGRLDAFALKLDAVSGSTAWSANFGGVAADTMGNALAVDGTGGVYLAGSVGGAGLTTPTLPKIGDVDAFALKLDASNGVTEWARQFGGSLAATSAQSLAVNGAGDVYLGGSFGFADLTTPALPRIGYQDAFLFKLNGASGDTAWARNYGGNGANALGQTLAVDGTGGVYLGGNFQSNLTVPALTQIGTVDGFALKVDGTTGTLNWAKDFAGAFATVDVRSLAVDSTGKLHLGGTFDSTLSTPALIKLGSRDAFAIELDAATGLTTRADGYDCHTPGGNAGASATATDNWGNVYIAGYFDGAVLNIGDQTLARTGAVDAYVAKLDAAGNVLWAKSFGGHTGDTSVQALAVDGLGNVFLGGNFTAALVTPALAKIGSQDVFVLRLDSATGDATWAKSFGGVGAFAYGNALAADGVGNLYIAGYFFNAELTTPPLAQIGQRDAFVFKLDGATGTTNWARSFGGAVAATYGNALAIDGANNPYLGGVFVGAELSVPLLARLGDQDAFALKLNAATGAVVWAKNFGGYNTYMYSRALAADLAGDVYLGGSFAGTAPTTPALPRSGPENAFAIRLDGNSGATLWAKNIGGILTYVQSLAADTGGQLILGGYFLGSSMTSPLLAEIGIQDAFAVRLNASTGAITAGSNFGGGDVVTFGQAIASDGAGNVRLVGGFYHGNLTMPPLNILGDTDAFVLSPTHGISYDGSGNTAGSAPIDNKGYWSGDTLAVAGAGSLTRTGHTFGTWNTAANGSGTSYAPGSLFPMAAADVTLYAQWTTVGSAPLLVSATSRKVHGTAGTFDLALGNVSTNPSTEPRTGPSQTIVMSFNKPIASAGTPTMAEGSATIGTVNIAGNDVTINLTGVANAQYVTFSLANVAAADGGTGGHGNVRVGFLFGDATQSRQVTVADVGIVNASLLQAVSNANFLLDVNADGKLSVADKGLTNANLLIKLPAP